MIISVKLIKNRVTGKIYAMTPEEEKQEEMSII
jgi:hypothetical protein